MPPGDAVITVVSGLPRSGTSMMMQVLEAGGMSLLIDDARPADIDNPRGYHELEKVAGLARDFSWLGEAENKVIKVVSMLLYELPADRCYKILFMTRNMEEILASQAAMLERLGKKQPGGPDDKTMAAHYSAHLVKLKSWLSKRSFMDVMYCDYNALLDGPAPQLELIRDFVGVDLDLQAMLRAIDPSLQRQKCT